MHGISSNAIYFTPDIGESPGVKARFKKSWGTRDQIANIHWITEKTKQLQKNIYICFMDCVDQKPVENS